MKLYTKLQVEEIYLQGWYDGKIGFKDRIDDAISYQTSIELPSDKEIEEGSRNYIKGTDLDTFVERTFFKSGAKWMKEQILNQNK